MLKYNLILLLSRAASLSLKELKKPAEGFKTFGGVVLFFKRTLTNIIHKVVFNIMQNTARVLQSLTAKLNRIFTARTNG